MTTVKRLTDLTKYASVLPYDSELFGVYQPLLGWKSVRIERRYREGFKRDQSAIVDRLTRSFSGLIETSYNADGMPTIKVKPGVATRGSLRLFDSLVLEKVSEGLPALDEYKPEIWSDIITRDLIGRILDSDVPEHYTRAYSELLRSRSAVIGATRPDRSDPTLARSRFEAQLRYESAVAGSLLSLVKDKNFDALHDIFYRETDDQEVARRAARSLNAENPIDAFLNFETLDPQDIEHLKSVALSPIGVVHLFRQYFFELDSFLGPPQKHVWLSPGSSVELIEIHTRRSITERSLSTVLETTLRTESTVTTQDELSEAVKQDNDQAFKFGQSVTASYATVQATASMDYSSSQKSARETTHKRMREQTDKLASEIRKNVTSTFKTVTEFTDTSSTKHLLANTTPALINYELRRKMRQVAVQVHDNGTYLCWQTYVDDPGRSVGVSELIHIAVPPELDGLPHPEEIPLLQSFVQEPIVTIPFITVDGTDADNEDEVYVDGVEADDSEFLGSQERVECNFPQSFVCPKGNYELANVEFDPQGRPVSVSRTGPIQNSGSTASFMLHVDSVDFQGQNSTQVKLALHWAPTAAANDAIVQQNNSKLAEFKEAEKRAYEKALIETVKERVTLASKIRPRSSEDLREEERIVVYRKLIQDMLLNGVPLPDDQTRHVVAELLNAIFDVEKMLYFVAPEWWRSRLHRGRQQMGENAPSGPKPVVGNRIDEVFERGLFRRATATNIAGAARPLDAAKVGWGGVNDINRDNYYITQDSDVAKLGSSLGWLLQLDGDNMRNAFLNAPWVKAVIPIRPGKEKAAINWLKGVEGMNGITDDAIYHTDNPNEKDVDGNPLDGQKMIDVLMDLAEKIRRKYLAGLETDKYPKPSEVSDPELVDDENTVTATPIDRVYEHGFFPLEGGFRANVGDDYEIFDQWLEVLPTDQSVPVPVAYDPATGRQLP
jgi:hypothetical protein